MGSLAHMGGKDEEVGGQKEGRADKLFFLNNEKKKTTVPLERHKKTLKTSTNSS